MKQRNKDKTNQFVKILLLLITPSLLLFSHSTFSEEIMNYVLDNTEETKILSDVEEEKSKSDIETTGTRLIHNTNYKSLSPVQIYTAQDAREIGKIDTTDILQNLSIASGRQHDFTFSGMLTDNGPGIRTINFRGLGDNRTLLLLNGRRVGPSGVEGAPSVPDLNLIPGGLIQRYELLLDGSSSIYGSAAIAGVANIILRNDFDGFEINYSTTVPEQSGGLEQNAAITWGRNFERGFIGFGAQISELEEVKYKDRTWTNHCIQNVEIDENGNIRHEDLFEQRENLNNYGNCIPPLLVGRVLYPNTPFGSLYYSPGIRSNTFGEFSESSIFGIPLDLNGDNLADIQFINYGLQDFETGATLLDELKTQNFMAYGEYTFDGVNNITPFFEAMYSRRDNFNNSGQQQTYPTAANPVPANNPFNLCNPNSINGGLDCGLSWDSLMNNPVVIDTILAEFGCNPSAGGSCDQTIGAIGAIPARPIFAIRGDRNITTSTIEQTRFVAGVKGDIPQFNLGQMNSWSFESFVSFHESDGVSSRKGIRQDRLEYSLNTSRIDSTSNEVICGNNDGCVPINLFAPSLYQFPVGEFATQTEREYLFDNRTFRTIIKQNIFFGSINGYFYDLPAGPLAGGIGVEIRRDEINSRPSEIARDGLLLHFFTDQGAEGSRVTKEAFGELEIPVIAGITGIEELVLNISGRYSDNQFFPSVNTYSIKLGYRPIPSMLFNVTKGTSYREPSLRENFLISQTGFTNIFDPCVTPEFSLDRDPTIFANCERTGVDSNNFPNNGNTVYSIETSLGGTTNIIEEQSDSLTYGFAWNIPFESDLSIAIGATYYEIEIDNSIIQPSTQGIINTCFFDQTLANSFCDRITRDPVNGIITLIDIGSINSDKHKARGVDVNFNFDKSIVIAKSNIDLGLDMIMTHTKENSKTKINTDVNGFSTSYFDDDKGEFGFPKWSGAVRLKAILNNFKITWQTRYIGPVHQDIDTVDEFSNINGVDTNTGNRTFSDTCLGPEENDVNCRDVGFADTYLNHTLSFFWNNNDWTLGFGVRNVFNKKPPEVDSSELLTVVNIPQGYGYDLNGRRYFLNISKRF